MCIVKHNLTPLDIANRIMREDNYLIALMNKNLLNVSLPLPLIGRRHFLPESLEWNIKRCIVGHIFYGKSRTLHKRVLLPERVRNALFFVLLAHFSLCVCFVCCPLLPLRPTKWPLL